MGDLGVFEAMDSAGKLSAEAAANNGFELEKSIDRAIFRAKERFGAYLANSQSKTDFDERWNEVKPQVIRLVAEVTTPTPGVLRRVGAALRPQAPKAPAKRARPSSVKAVSQTKVANGDADEDDQQEEGEQQQKAAGSVERFAEAVEKMAAITKQAWSYDKVSHLYTSNDPMQKFACPGCGTEQPTLGFSHCAGCDRTWNSWPVRQQGTDKTSSSTYVLMAREVKMRGDQYKLAGLDKAAAIEEGNDGFDGTPADMVKNQTFHHNNGSKGPLQEHVHPLPPSKKVEAAFGQDGPPPMSQPNFGTMPGDNSGATGAPMAPAQPATPVAAAGGDRDGDGDVAGGITEDSPIDQIQDALQDAIVALKDVQMLSVNPALLQTSSATKASKIANLRTAMDRFWTLHKQMNIVAGMLAQEANEAIKTVDPRITAEGHFVRGFQAAASNRPLPAPTKDKHADREFLAGYVAFFKQADLPDGNFVPTGNDETAAGNRGEGSNGFLRNLDGMQPANEIRGDAGTFDASQPASKDFASDTDRRNRAGESRGQTGESSSIQPHSSNRRSR